MEREGASLSRKYRRAGSKDQFISRADRLAVYERDQWTCQLCRGPVDPANLRLAHRSCNSARGNRHAAGA